MKKILLSIGTLGAIAAPLATVVACGDKTKPLSLNFDDASKSIWNNLRDETFKDATKKDAQILKIKTALEDGFEKDFDSFDVDMKDDGYEGSGQLAIKLMDYNDKTLIAKILANSNTYWGEIGDGWAKTFGKFNNIKYAGNFLVRRSVYKYTKVPIKKDKSENKDKVGDIQEFYEIFALKNDGGVLKKSKIDNNDLLK